MEIPCYYCTGFAGESHAWNIVMLDDEFYNIDTTYDYFNKTAADYVSSHIRWDLSVYLPPCNGQAYMENAMMEIGASSCEIILEVEELQNERYLIGHEFVIQ